MSATFTGDFKKGMSVGKEIHMDFELRQMTTEDMLDAEMEASTATPMNFNVALIIRQLVRVGTYEGPFVASMVRKLDPKDFNLLSDALQKVAKLGEDSSPTTATA